LLLWHGADNGAESERTIQLYSSEEYGTVAWI
jgi:hypothetical protein